MLMDVLYVIANIGEMISEIEDARRDITEFCKSTCRLCFGDNKKWEAAEYFELCPLAKWRR